jgi:ubiquinone/menaquinone biosynthesis C-methylase UbiE
MGVEGFSKELVKKNGIWYSSKKDAISYPEEGNEVCFQLEDNSFWFRHRNNCITTLVKHFSPAGPFFDVGGGNGFVAKAVEDLGIETFLVEPGERGCINGQKRGLRNIICSTLENAGFEENSLPAIGAFDVVEHIESDTAILNSFNRYLVKGGLVFITVPAYRSIWSTEDDHAGHYNRYTLRELRKKLDNAGFDMLYSSYLFTILPVTIFLFRTAAGKFRKKLPEASRDHDKNITLLNKLWDWELKRVKARKKIGFGSSCLVVAKKR